MLVLQKSDPPNLPKTKKHSLIPDFLIIGAGKCGTTSLFMYLRQHPEIFIPSVKEPNFYGYQHTNPRDLDDPAEVTHFMNSVTDLRAYINLFKDAAAGQIKGEMSNTYMYHERAPERIRYYNPEMKLIAILRQPAGRLYSRFMHLVREDRVPTKSFSDCLDRGSIWWKRNDLIREGFYYKNLKPFYELFPRDQIKIYLYEEFGDHAPEVLRDIFNFLNVNPDFRPDAATRFNQSGVIKNKFLNRIYGQSGLLTSGFEALFPENVAKKVKQNVRILKTVNNLRGKNLAKPKPDPAVLDSLTQNVYADDIQRLQNLIGKDLSHWLKPNA